MFIEQKGFLVFPEFIIINYVFKNNKQGDVEAN